MAKTIKFLIVMLLPVAVVGLSFHLYNNRQKDGNNESAMYINQKARQLKNRSEPLPKQSFCGNTYFPFIPGSYWKYVATEGQNEAILKLEVLETPLNEPIMEAKLDTLTWVYRHEFLCEEKGIVFRHLYFLTPHQSAYTIATPISISGFLLPGNVDAITFWNFIYEEKIETLNSESSQIEKTLYELHTCNLQIAGNELINTPFGQHDARHIIGDCSISRSEAQESLSGGKGNNKAKIDIWLADQIGIVKSIYHEDQNSPSVLELKGFQIPAKRPDLNSATSD